jgi:hypothetical protein
MNNLPDKEPLLAYRDEDFLDTEDARPLRILSECLAPLRAFRQERVHDTVVFFGSARLREDGRFCEEARLLSRLITERARAMPANRQRLIVCTGGGGGIMEAANRAATQAGGRTIGLNIGLPKEQRPNRYLTPGLSFECHYFFMRKLWFAHLARACRVPGRFWNDGRTLENADSRADAQARSQTRSCSLRLELLEGADQP